MPRRSRKSAVWSAAAACLPALLLAQQPASDEIRVSSQLYVAQSGSTFRAETKLVDVGIAVRDGHGRGVPGLQRDSFRIFDDGKERKIAAFSEIRAGSDGSPRPPEAKFEPASQPAAESRAQSAPAQPAPAQPAAPAQSALSQSAPAQPGPARYLALFFDDVNATYGKEAGDLTRAQSAAARFVKGALPPEVQIGIFTASGAQSLDFTADRAKLLPAIAELKAHPHFSEKICFGINPYQAYRIAQERDRETLRLAIVAAANSHCPASPNQVMTQAESVWNRVKESSMGTLAAASRVVSYLAGKPGERILVFASSGFASGTLEPQENRIIDQAIRSAVVINALVTKGLYNELSPSERFDDDPAPTRAGWGLMPGRQNLAKAEAAELSERPMVMDEAMANLAQGTGGVLFHNNNDLNAGFRETTVAPDVTYRLSFNPEGVASDGSFHKLQVKLVHAAAYSVEARPGYFAPEEMAAPKLRETIDKEVTGSDSLAGLAAGVALQMDKISESQRTIHVIVHLDISKLEFAKQNDRRSQRITFVAAFFDAAGKMTTAKEGRMDLALKPETYDRLAKSGVNAELTLQASPGAYKMRAVVAESVKGSMAASTYPIDVR